MHSSQPSSASVQPSAMLQRQGSKRGRDRAPMQFTQWHAHLQTARRGCDGTPRRRRSRMIWSRRTRQSRVPHRKTAMQRREVIGRTDRQNGRRSDARKAAGATNGRTRRRRETRRLDLEARTAPRRAPRRTAARAPVAGALRGRCDGRRSKTGRPPRDELAEYAEATTALPRRRASARIGTIAGRRRAPGAPAPA